MARLSQQQQLLLLLATAACAIAGAASLSSSSLALRIVPAEAVEATNASCLDGSPPAYWFVVRDRAAPWIVALEGGAWCWQLTEDPTNAMASCPDRAASYLGTSRGLPATVDVSTQGIMSPDPVLNPRFAGYNVAQIHYCDGSFFSSNNPTPVPANVSGQPSHLLFRGRPNVAAVLLDLVATQGLGQASELLFTGGSAGGQGVVLLADWVREAALPRSRFPALLSISAVADASVFLDAGDYATGAHQYRARLTTAEPLWQSVEQRTLDLECLAAYASAAEQWRCYFPQYSAPFVSTPLFLLNSATDAEQLYDDFRVGCCPLVDCSHVSPHPGPACNATQMQAILGYARNFYTAISLVLQGRPGMGAFIDTCYIHVQSMLPFAWANYSVPDAHGRRVTVRDAVAAWYNATLTGSAAVIQLLNEPEVFPSNPSCPYPPPPQPPPSDR
jgi:hypothetical protein